jgi:hypothetical protein
MLSNKILPDESRAGNENRAHVAKAGRYQMMTPCDGSGSAGAVSPGDMGPGILNGNSVPMTLDPHAGARRSNDNISVKAPEVSRTARTREIDRRLTSGNTKYKY